MLTQNMYALFLATLKDQQPLYVAVGAGLPAWDDAPPAADIEVAQLVAEVGRKVALPEAVVYLDADDNAVETPTPRLQVAVTFDEEVGTLRECGLFGGAATDDPNSGTLLAYYVHAKVEKTPGTPLLRWIVIDLTPRDATPGRHLTRYLGNACERELHDLDNEKTQCQIDEIALDRRFYFDTVEQAKVMDYDLCGHCFREGYKGIFSER